MNSPGGHIEQSYKYLDPMDVSNWRALISQSRYAAMVEAIPLSRHRLRGSQRAGPSGLDVVGLGVGTGRHELRLVSHCLDRDYSNLRLYLLDISQPLLNIACQQAREALSSYPEIRITAINGDFFHLPSYQHIFNTAHRRQRLICMFGATSGTWTMKSALRDL